MNEELIIGPLQQNNKKWLVNDLEENVKNTIESIRMDDAKYQYTRVSDSSERNANERCCKVLETYRKQYLDLIDKCGNEIPLYKKEHENRNMACDFPFTKIKEQDTLIKELTDQRPEIDRNIRLENQINRMSKAIIILVSIILLSIMVLLIILFYNSNKKHTIKRLIISSLISSFFGFFMFGVYLLSGRMLRFLYFLIFISVLIISALWFYCIYDRQRILLSIMFLVILIFVFILFGFIHHLFELRFGYRV